MWKGLAASVLLVCSALALSAGEKIDIDLLTGPDNPPFTDPGWEGQGLMTELVTAAFEGAPDPVSLSISWNGDWSRQLFPILDGLDHDMGFPWMRPDCAGEPSNPVCAGFHFSDPVLDVVVLLFSRAEAPVPFDSDEDLLGRTLCLPSGFSTGPLDRDGRGWARDGKVKLRQPATAADCFELLMAGEVDGAVLNEFLGVQLMFAMGLTDRIVPSSRPISVEGLHVVISKKHWRGTTHLYRFNAGLAALRSSARYDEIVARHLTLFWQRIKAETRP